MQDIFAELKWRGMIHQSTAPESLGAWLLERPRTLYAGFDPTADSLHVGHVVPLVILRRFQRAGHRPIAVVGGATGMIGDPSGKSEERNLLSLDTLRANVSAMETQMRRFLDFDEGPGGAVLVNNHDWMSRFGFLEFLRDIGKNFPINVMLAKDSVKARLERTDSGMSFTEFSYMLLQAYDFVHLFDAFGCELQVGGSDQWGNITAGVDLGRRTRSAQLHGITCPLLTKSDGAKMGKTESGAIWLSPEKTSPYRFYQYWINVDDADVGKCLRFFTDLPREELNSLDAARESDPGKRESQIKLAEEFTKLVHGEAGMSKAKRASAALFGAELDELSATELTDIFAEVPSADAPAALLSEGGLNIVDALVTAGLAKSKSDARRVVESGGAYVNNRRVERLQTALGRGHLLPGDMIVLRSGKRKYALLRALPVAHPGG